MVQRATSRSTAEAATRLDSCPSRVLAVSVSDEMREMRSEGIPVIMPSDIECPSNDVPTLAHGETLVATFPCATALSSGELEVLADLLMLYDAGERVCWPDGFDAISARRVTGSGV